MELPQISAFPSAGENLKDLGPKWDRWRRGFEYYSYIGKGIRITEKKRKSTLLLHCARPRVQVIFQTLPETGSETDYEAAIQALTAYFKLMVNKFYEKYKF
jgi:hypothetical protein